MKHFKFQGYNLYLGESALENDKLVSHAEPDDMWFHLHGKSSPHLILVNRYDTSLSQEVIQFACKQVRLHSKEKNKSNVKVDLIYRKYIKTTKIPGKVQLLKKPQTIHLKE